MGKWCLHASLFLGNKDMFKNYKRFDFWHVQMADIGGTKPWKNNCSLIWKLFKFLMTLLAGLFEMRGCWHIGLRWAIVALWATCLIIPRTCIETWKIKAWQALTDLDKKKRGIAIALSLPEEGQNSFRDKVFSELTVEVLNADDGVEKLILFMDKISKKDELSEAYEAYMESRAMFWNMQPVIKVIRPFCFHKKIIVPKGCLVLPWGYIYTCIK